MPTGALYWLGPPRVEVEGRVVRLETRKITALLALLSVDRRPHSRERIAAMFWPEYDSVRAPANLRRALASLQGSLGTGWLAVDRDTIEFTSNDRITIDCVEFASAVEDLRARLTGGGSLTASRPDSGDAEKLRAALELFQGQFLEGFNLKDCPEFDQWQTVVREELLQDAGWALERLAEFDSAAGNWAEAIKEAQRWLALDNLNEAAHRTLMFLFARSGKRNTALKQFETCCRLLDEELGQEPDDQTAALAERIRQRKIDAADHRPAAGPSRDADPSRENGQTPQTPASSALRLRQTAAPVEPVPAKYLPPPLRQKRVERSRLFGLLDEGLSRPVTLVSAPAGFGKTTLVSEWIERAGLQAAWLSIDEGDDSPSRFLSSLASAVARFGGGGDGRDNGSGNGAGEGGVSGGIGAEALRMLKGMQTPPLARVIDSLVNDLSRAPAPRILVLDDYHLVRNPDTQELLSLLVDRVPADFHLLISTRTDPPLPLPRLRARDQLIEVRAEDLRFSSQEASAFLREVMELELAETDVEALGLRTEGWAAGLQMAGLSLRGRENPSEYIRGFEGKHRYIMDYLLGEVLDKLDPDTHRFLLLSSVLRRFCAPLCDAVTEREDSWTMIEAIERANLFLIALDENRQWYRYHHLFSDLLLHRLHQESGAEKISLLRERAGQWFEEAGDIDEAMHQYLTGGHFDRALRLMDEKHEAILFVGGLGTLMGWAQRIPQEEVLQSAAACATFGTLAVYTGNGPAAAEYFSRAESLLADNTTEAAAGEDRRNHLLGRVGTMRAYVADLLGKTDRAVELARIARPLLSPDARYMRALIPYILGKSCRYEGEFAEAEKNLSELERLGRAAQNVWMVAAAAHEMIGIHQCRGNLVKAESTIRMVEEMPREPGSEGPIVKIFAHRGELQRERGELTAAGETLNETLLRAERWGLPSDIYFCRVTRGRLGLSRGDLQAAEEDIGEAERVGASSLVYPTLVPLLERERVRLWAAQGRLPQLRNWLQDCPADRELRPLNRELLLMTKARALIAGGGTEEARRLLEDLAPAAESGGRFGRLLEIRLLQALAENAAGNLPAAMRMIESALSLAEPENYVRLFLDEGDPLVGLLDRYSHAGRPDNLAAAEYARRLEDYARRLIAARGT